jgi:dissimilatory sulfite reductase (desulfoviridin) alpha/beta subunit
MFRNVRSGSCRTICLLSSTPPKIFLYLIFVGSTLGRIADVFPFTTIADQEIISFIYLIYQLIAEYVF